MMRHPLPAKDSYNQSAPVATGSLAVKVWKTGFKGAVLFAVLVLGLVYLAPNRLLSPFGWWPAQRVQAQGASPFTFTDFSTPHAGTGALQGTIGTSINDNGDVAGIYLNTNGTATNVAHGFIRTAAGTITEFDTPHAGTGKNQGTFPTGINANDEIVGMYFDSNNAYHGFLRSATGAITEFDVPGAPTTVGHRGTTPLSINSNGDIAGLWIDSTSDVRHGFVRTAAGTFTSFDAPGASLAATWGTVPFSINASGTITGYYNGAGGTAHGFMRAANGTITAPLDAPGAGTGWGKVGGGGTIPTSVNTAGDVAGVYGTATSYHGFVYTASSSTPAFTTFDAPNVVVAGIFPGTLAASMNAGGVVSGVYTDTQGDHHGFVRAADGTFTSPVDDPNSVYATSFSGSLLVSINTTGQMTGTYQDVNSVFHAFVATPAQGPVVATPTFSPAAGTYTSAQTVTMSDSTTGASIYYTTNGQTPTAVPGELYSGPFTVSTTETVQAIATATGYSNSSLASATYTIAAATPTFSPAAGTYTSAQTVTISDATTGATIYYTTDGSTPTAVPADLYSGPITVNTTETVKAIATASGLSNSAVGSATYTINLPAAATPTFSPAAGTYTSAQTVTISDATTGATIYYTTDGSTPTAVPADLYSGPITVSTTETLKAIATASGLSNSAVASATYTVNLPQPDFQLSVSPSNLTISRGQSGTATFTVTPVNGFNSAVTFSCSGLPAETSCTFNPTSVTPSGSPVTSTVTVKTTAKTTALLLPRPSLRGPVYAMMLPVFGLVFAIGTRQRRMRLRTLLLAASVVLLAVGLASCGSGSGGSTGGGDPGTPLGTSTVSITAAASGTGGANHAAALTITVTQ